MLKMMVVIFFFLHKTLLCFRMKFQGVTVEIPYYFTAGICEYFNIEMRLRLTYLFVPIVMESTIMGKAAYMVQGSHPVASPATVITLGRHRAGILNLQTKMVGNDQ